MNELSDVELRQIDGRWKSDMDLKMDRVDVRVRTIEQLVWVATGGVVVLSAVSVIGVSILAGFASKLELVSQAQAVSIAEQRLTSESLQKQIDQIRERMRR